MANRPTAHPPRGSAPIRADRPASSISVAGDLARPTLGIVRSGNCFGRAHRAARASALINSMNRRGAPESTVLASSRATGESFPGLLSRHGRLPVTRRGRRSRLSMTPGLRTAPDPSQATRKIDVSSRSPQPDRIRRRYPIRAPADHLWYLADRERMPRF
jgi:hypothetical protein